MEYHEAVNALEGLRRLRPKLGTETTASLLAVHGNPHENLTAIQIAGSNGKGSTAAVLDSILRNTGLTVGLYTSPDLNDLRERIRVQGEKIPKADVIEFVTETWPEIVDSAADGDAPTFFEVFTAMALWHFERERVDIAILEVGIGGQYDATSVVDPVAAAVTTVSLEHTDILGSTLQEIASDKAQVAPASAPLVTGATGEALDTIREQTDVLTVGATSELPDRADSQSLTEERATDVHVTETEMLSLTEAAISLGGPDWSVETRTPMLGKHGALNAGIATALAHQVAEPTEANVAAGIRNANWPGRFEVMSRKPLVVLDGAHNPAACERLSSVLERFEYDSLTLVFGAMRDKDHAGMARAVRAVDRLVLAEPDVSRAADTDLLAAIFDREIETTITQEPSVLGALESALASADSGDCVLVTGSLYTVAEARDRFTRAPTPVRTENVSRAHSLMHAADISRQERQRTATRMVHRTVQFHARRAGATAVKEAMLSLGGSCCISGIETADEHVEMVVAGTIEQFQQLGRLLADRGGEHAHLARQLERALVRTAAPNTYETDSSPDTYPWTDSPSVMGILNVTPDSFHDGGEYRLAETAVLHAEQMATAGAEIIDIGGESTRPGAEPVSPKTERERVVPVIEALADRDMMLSIDTRKPSVAKAALEAGADIINDVSGLADAEMRHLVAEWNVPVILMHSLSVPVDPSRSYAYGDVVSDVRETLTERLLLADRAGIDRSNVVIDPGLGFGKAAEESFELLNRLDEFRAFGCPLLVGHSRKSMFGDLPHADDRLAHTIAASALAVDRGADIVRVHDVPENVAAVATAVHTATSGDEGAPTNTTTATEWT